MVYLEPADDDKDGQNITVSHHPEPQLVTVNRSTHKENDGCHQCMIILYHIKMGHLQDDAAELTDRL